MIGIDRIVIKRKNHAIALVDIKKRVGPIPISCDISVTSFSKYLPSGIGRKPRVSQMLKGFSIGSSLLPVVTLLGC